jgi:hypothetical protein
MEGNFYTDICASSFFVTVKMSTILHDEISVRKEVGILQLSEFKHNFAKKLL